jgi:hypothetical protein
MVEDEVSFNAPIPGQGLTAELGARPWQTPPQYTTVEDALDYYIPRLESEEVSEQLLDVLEMGVPVTNVADTMQTGGVLQGKHSVDVGMLILPVLVELIMVIADAAGIKYTSGLEKDKRIRGSLVDLAKSKMEEADSEEQETEPEEEMVEVDKEEKAGGLMSRGM